jgi:hypothetical protein
MTQDLVFQSRKDLDYPWRTNGQELSKSNMSIPIAPGGVLHSTVNDVLKFLSANIGLIKTKLDDAMKESHLIRYTTGQLLPTDLQISDKDNNIGVYVGLGLFIITNFGHESYGITGLLLVVTMPTWRLTLYGEGYCL